MSNSSVHVLMSDSGRLKNISILKLDLYEWLANESLDAI